MLGRGSEAGAIHHLAKELEAAEIH
jgi:hypothetical protein